MNAGGTVRARPIIDADQAGQYFYGVTEHDLGTTVPSSPSVTPVRYRIYNTGRQPLYVSSIAFPSYATNPGGGVGQPLSNVAGSLLSPTVLDSLHPIIVPAFNPLVTYATDIEDLTQNPAPYVDIIVGVKPAAVGAFLLPVKVSCNDADEANYDWLIRGTAADAPEIQVLKDGVIDIADTETGAPVGTETVIGGGTLVNQVPEKAKTFAFTIKNIGNLDLTVSRPTLTTTTANAVLGTDPWGAAATITIAKGASQEFSIVIYPTLVTPPGPWSVAVSFANNDGDEDPFNFLINGTATVPLPEIDITRGTSIPDGGLDIADIPVGVPQTFTYVIRNIGDTTLALYGSSLAGSRNATVTVSALAPMFLARNTSTTITATITRTGTSTDVWAADIRVDNNDPNEAAYIFQATNFAAADSGDGKKCGFGMPFGMIALLSLFLVRRRTA
jgi:hypothetical protein